MTQGGSITAEHGSATDRTATAEMEVLVVDDEKEIAETTSLMLSHHQENIETTVETNPTVVLDILNEQDIDCVVCDYDMPDMDGLEVLKQIREHYPDLPFILFTGRGSEEIASQAISAGVTDYLQKKGHSDQFTVLSNRVMNAIGKYRAEQTLSDIQQFQKLVEYATDVISVVDQNGKFRFVTPSSNRILGYEPAEMLGNAGFEYVHEDDRMAVMESFATAVENPEQIVTEKFRFDHPDGWIWIESRARNMVEDPDIGGLVIYSRDITELEQRERAYERLERFANSLSRDLGNPLDAARDRLDELEATEDLSHARDVDSALQRMDESLEDLLTLARYEDGPEELTPVPLERSVTEAWENVAIDGIELATENTERILADPPRLTQLLENLYRNTADHAPGAERVVVGTMDDGFYVEDDGDGIPAESREQVWGMGYSTLEDGTGTGLAIVKEITRAHGWTADLAESESGGTRFEFTGVQFV